MLEPRAAFRGGRAARDRPTPFNWAPRKLRTGHSIRHRSLRPSIGTLTVHVPAGKTTVIGGLVQKSTFDSERKVPILGDIPILGYLFRSTSSQTTETTLAFHITPRIIQGAQGMSSFGL